ncbi:unnamed protein product, partial [Discosporangium mesarthrocarpum]
MTAGVGAGSGAGAGAGVGVLSLAEVEVNNPLAYMNRYAKAVPYPGMPPHKGDQPPLWDARRWQAFPPNAEPRLPADATCSPRQTEEHYARANLEPPMLLLLQLERTMSHLLVGNQWSG